METFSLLLALCEGDPPVTGGFPHKGRWRGALIFSLICARTNDEANNRNAGDLRRHRAHYNVTLIYMRETPVRLFLCIILCFVRGSWDHPHRRGRHANVWLFHCCRHSTLLDQHKNGRWSYGLYTIYGMFPSCKRRFTSCEWGNHHDSVAKQSQVMA